VIIREEKAKNNLSGVSFSAISLSRGKKRGRVRSLDQTREKLKRKKLFNKEVLIE